MQIRKRIVTALAALIIIEAGIQLGATYARFGPQIHEGEVLALSSAILRGPDGLRRPVDPAIQTQSCRCRRMWDTCPCESTFRLPVSDHIVWDQLQKLNPEFNRDINAEFPAQLVEATGFEIIAPGRSHGPARIRTTRSVKFLQGRLEELLLEYDIPQNTVRAVYAHHAKPTRDLIIVTLGSWSTAEHVLGLRPEDYHRQIGRYYFEKGLDVLVFDHGSNSTIEAMQNVATLLQDTQIYGLWARSICDIMDALTLRDTYDRIVLYGLSRGGRVVEYTAAMCPGFAFAIVGDNLDQTGLQDYY